MTEEPVDQDPTREGAASNGGGGVPLPEHDSAEVAELENRLRRALADLDNLRKRFARELDRQLRAERDGVVAEWLPVVDNLERALDQADGDAAALVAGVQAVRDQALSILGRLGYPRFEDVGERFDPARHEAVGTAETDDPAGTIVAASRAGYGTDDSVLRPAAVVVARSPH